MNKYLELVEGAFTQEHLDKQNNQKPYVAYSIKDGNVIYTIVSKEEKDMWIITTVELKDVSNYTYNMIDLGLPSGLKWADRNVGASSPEHYGSYFQWGDINAYAYNESVEITTEQLVGILNPLLGPELGMEITVDNVKYVLASLGLTGNDLRDGMKAADLNAILMDKEFNLSSYFDNTFEKYNNNEGLTVLESSDDAATVYMGSQYRMPTIEEMGELMYNTTQTFIDINGNEFSKEQLEWEGIDLEMLKGALKGMRFTGPNDHSIFIPVAGFCNGNFLIDARTAGNLWSSSLGSNDSEANCGNYIGDTNVPRYYGLSVRGVQA